MAALLEVRGLTKRFPGAAVPAVADVDLDLSPGESLGLVGESGCGKTTLARCIVRLEEASAGSVTFDGTELTRLSGGALRTIRRRVQVVFQDPIASLNPRLTVRAMLEEPLRVHRIVPIAELEHRAVELLEQVGLDRQALPRYPHEFSAGQRQRLGLARALSVSPELIIADEPVSALDASVRAQVINLMQELRAAHGLAYLFISHDLELVRYVCDRVMVMVFGRVVEEGTTEQLYGEPAHPYTRALHAATPRLDGSAEASDPPAAAGGAGTAAAVDSGRRVPLADTETKGCPYRSRCPLAEPRCGEERPRLRVVGDGHRVACHVA